MRVKLKDIKPNQANPRIIRDKQFADLKRSIIQFPQMLDKRGIAVIKEGGKWVAIGGNQRYRALTDIESDMKTAGFEARYNIGPAEMQILDDYFVNGVPVVDCTDLTPDQQRRFIIADNLPFGEWDTDALANEWDLDELKDWGMSLPEWGEGEGGGMPEAQEDDYEIPDEIQTDIVLGDLFEIGPHRLLCGDSTKVEDVERLMNGCKIDMVFTSPPYNQGGGGMKYDYYGESKSLYKQEKTDKKTKDEYFTFCLDIIKNIVMFSKKDSAVFWNVMYNANARDDYGKIVFSNENPLSVKETIIWDKTHPFPTASKGILSRRCELVFLMCSGDKYKTNQGENEVISNYWEINSNGSQIDGHKACYPVGLPEKGILLCSKEGDNIFDPFLGSGTTMVAAHQLNRVCYGLELDSKYCQVIVDRMLKLDPTLEVKKNGQPYQKPVINP